MQKLLSRQLQDHFGSHDAIPDAVKPFVEAVAATYEAMTAERAQFEQSMIVASETLYQRNLTLRDEHRALDQTLSDLREETLITDALNRIGQVISAELDLQQLLQRVVEIASNITQAEFGILCCDASHAENVWERLRAATGPDLQAADRFSQHYLRRLSAMHGAMPPAVNLGCTQETPASAGAIELQRAADDAGIRSLLVAPIRNRHGTVAGALYFGHSRKDAFVSRDERLAQGIASQAAIAIDNARLFRAAQEANERLAHQAHYDALTQLPNRAMFRQRAEEALKQSQSGDGGEFAVLFIDLDRFKAVNDQHGHETGDRLLQATADRLRECVHASEADAVSNRITTVARLGGDEFTAIVEQVTDAHHALAIAKRIVRALNTPFMIDGHDLRVSASIGVACGGGDVVSIDDILRDADAAMYQAKLKGKDCCVLFDSAISDTLQARARLESDLIAALGQGDFRLQYQPITCLASRKLIGFEALIRWNRDGVLINPTDFIPIAEESNLIIGIGQWAIEEACRQVAEWRSDNPGLPPFSMSVNLSRRQLLDATLLTHVESCLRRYDIPPNCLKLEITESMVMQDMETSLETLQAIKALGVGLHMDDFGTGHSSLAYLSTLPLDGLKIDRIFIRNIAYRRDCVAILQAIISLAHTLGIKVVAEGIEEPEQVVLLQVLECDWAQGFYFSRPLDPPEAITFIHTTTHRAELRGMIG